VEGGASSTAADAETLLSGDVRFPTQAFTAMEKLYGWSIVVDVFHGEAHPIAVSIRTAVLEIGPRVMRMAMALGDTPAVGMELVCRVMYDMQQDYFYYLAKLVSGVAAVVPDFERVVGLVATQRVDALSALPRHWYALVGCPFAREAATPATPNTAPAVMRTGTGASVPVVNAHADRRMMNRFRDGGYATITAMVGGRTLTYPKQGNNTVCMSWALKGACNSTCKRVTSHVRYTAATNAAIHAFMDQCEVASVSA
jgi:hypothetical protein